MHLLPLRPDQADLFDKCARTNVHRPLMCPMLLVGGSVSGSSVVSRLVETAGLPLGVALPLGFFNPSPNSTTEVPDFNPMVGRKYFMSSLKNFLFGSLS